MPAYDALLVVSFGGPERQEEVMPFLENVTRGRGVPRERLESVAEHYRHFGGKSPINEQNRALIASLAEELERHGVRLPIYFGNRNWAPLLTDAVSALVAREDGLRALRLVGPFAFTGVGVLLRVAAPLADAGVGILPVATFDTDYVLVPEARLPDALAALRAAGHAVVLAGGDRDR